MIARASVSVIFTCFYGYIDLFLHDCVEEVHNKKIFMIIS